MRVLLQRVAYAQVSVNQSLVAQIQNGLLLLVGLTHDDSLIDVDYLANKIAQIRIFNDENGKMNKSVVDINGGLLAVSQFTLFADAKKGNRPSFVNAAKPEFATYLFDAFVVKLSEVSKIQVQKGVFGADMKVELLNDGPVTIWLDSKQMKA
jgi:D-tyrosyl-tRNA(Tyr) deacylase